MNREDIEPLLPRNFQRTLTPGSPLDAVVELMQDLHAPSEAALAELDLYFDPWRAPDRFAPYLARWVDLGPLLDAVAELAGAGAEFPTGTGRLRELVGLAAFFSRWRGTRAGVQRFLEVATGEKGFAVDEDPDRKPFHVMVRAPKATETYRALIERIVELEKPAHVTYELSFG